MSNEELYHMIEQVINNRHPQNWRIRKLVEKLFRKYNLYRYDLIHDAYFEYEFYPHEQKSKETVLQSISRFTYNYLRRKETAEAKATPDAYIEETSWQEPAAEEYEPDLTPHQVVRESMLASIRRELTETDILVILKEKGLRAGAKIKGMKQQEYKDYLLAALERI